MRFFIEIPVRVDNEKAHGIPIPSSVRIEVEAETPREAANIFEVRLQRMFCAMEFR